jgi:hypothetical protein
MDFILRSEEQRLQIQFSMARKFLLQSVSILKCVILCLTSFDWSKLKNTGGALTNTVSFESIAQDSTTTPPLFIKYFNNILKKYKYHLPYLTNCLIFRDNKYNMAENA